MDSLRGKSILIFQHRNWGRTIGHFLASKLQTEGCRLAALTLKRSTHQFTLTQTDVKYESVISDDEVMSNPQAFLAGDRYTLEEICEDLGIDSIWPLVGTLRNHVKSYGEKYYYSFRQNVPDEEIVAYVMAVYKYVKRFFDEFRPNLILAPNFVALPNIMLGLYGKKRGVKMLAVTDSKVKGVYIFTYNFLDDEGPFFERLKVLNSGQTQSKNLEKAREYIREFRENFKRPDHAVVLGKRRSLWQAVRYELSPFYHSLRWYFKKPVNYLPNIGVTIDYRPPRIIWRDHFARKRYQKFMDRFSYYPLEKLGKFVYFPLQFQPEAAIDVVSPYFSNQVETARQVAMSLPGDYTLAVKEHPAMVGLRPPSYIEKIARTPNVRLLDYRLTSEEILKRSALVVCPNGTIVMEAAMYHKPVVQLGDLGLTLELPNVFKHSDLATLVGRIKEILGKNLNTADYERWLQNYIAAAFDTGFDFNYTQAWSKGGEMEPLWRIYEAEIKNALQSR